MTYWEEKWTRKSLFRTPEWKLLFQANKRRCREWRFLISKCRSCPRKDLSASLPRQGRGGQISHQNDAQLSLGLILVNWPQCLYLLQASKVSLPHLLLYKPSCARFRFCSTFWSQWKIWTCQMKFPPSSKYPPSSNLCYKLVRLNVHWRYLPLFISR